MIGDIQNYAQAQDNESSLEEGTEGEQFLNQIEARGEKRTPCKHGT